MTILFIVYVLILGYNLKESCQAEEFTGEVCSEEIKKAIDKMGPYYDYIMVGEILYVDRGDGKWLRLEYERR